MNWHAESQVLERYATGELDLAGAASLEAHLLECVMCRAALAQTAAAGSDRASAQARLDATWASIEDVLDAPRPGWIERVLVRAGVSGHLARLLAVTPTLRTSWLLAVAATLAFAAVAADSGRGEQGVFLFLLIAPLLPLAGVAAAFGPHVDPSYEISVVAPVDSFRLLLARSTAVVGTTIALIALASVVVSTVPQVGWDAAAWLLPSLALVLVSLALSSYVSPLVASAAVGAVWVVGVLASEVAATGLALQNLSHALADDGVQSVAFQVRGQVVLLAVAVLSAMLVARRREAFDGGRTA